MTPREELDGLLDFLFGFATRQLEARGEFFPFAAALGADGEPQVVGVDLGDEQPQSTELLDVLFERLAAQAEAGEIRAAGVCADVHLPETDAARASLEHAEHEPIEVFLPYRKKRLGRYEFGEVFAQSGERRIYR
jgi:hypothetical protein